MLDMVGNHLWQSTLFSIAVALLSFLFRKSHARIRYWLWFAASIKFIIPFSLFIAIGSAINLPWRQSDLAPQAAVSYVEDLSQPFGSTNTPAANPASAKPDQIHWMPIVLIAIWFCGAVAVSLLYLTRGLSLKTALQKSTPLKDGSLCEILRAIEIRSGRQKRIQLAISPSSIEPGVLGIFRPVLMMPEGILTRLKNSELGAIIAHEIAHVRHHDNLLAAVHMTIEALFWFHPMVWWIGSKLVWERELACDEEVLRMGKDPQAYAEGIIKVCEFYLESPLACVAGITGSNMKKRIHSIMTHHIGNQLSWMKKLILACVGVVAVAFPFAIGLMNAPSSRAQSQTSPRPSFEVASIKPSHRTNGISARSEHGQMSWDGVSVKNLITEAYNVQDFQLSGGPNWIGTDRYSMEAKAASPETSHDQMRLMLQSLLEERFKLKFHREERNIPVYALIIAKDGPKLKKSSYDEGNRISLTSSGPGSGNTVITDSSGKTINVRPPSSGKNMQHLAFYGGTYMQDLANALSRIFAPRRVIDKTGLTERYEVYLEWGADVDQANLAAGANSAPTAELGGPSIFTAIREQLGLTLEATKGPVEFFVIDSVEKPSEN